MGENKFSPGINNEQTEKEPREVARIFLFQSRKIESISEKEDLDNIFFTNLLLIRKGGTVNPDQLMPVGGALKPGESIEKAARRESTEETHLRPSEMSVRAFQSNQDYEFDHPRLGKLKIRAHYSKGKLSSPDLDIPFVLDNEEDKIENFVYLSPQQAEELFVKTGQVEIDGRVYFAQDALSPNPDARVGANTTINEQQRISVVQELLLHHRLTDARKKMMILRSLFEEVKTTELSESGQSYKETMQKDSAVKLLRASLWEELLDLEISHDNTRAVLLIGACDDFWKENIKHFNHEDVRLAMSYSDFGGKIYAAQTHEKDSVTQRFKSTYNPETGRGVPSVALLFPLIVDEIIKPDGSLDFRKGRIILSNPTFYKFFKLLRGAKKAEQDARARKKDLNDQDLLNYLYDDGYLDLNSNQTFAQLGQEVDTYFERLRDDAGLTDEEAPIDQLDEIKGASLVDLLKYARASYQELIDDDSLPRITNQDEARVLQFEARLKLIMALLLNDAIYILDESKALGIKPIEAIEDKVAARFKCYRQLRHDSETKTTMSLVRKMIVRNQSLGENYDIHEVARDVYAESYIFDDVTNEELEINNYNIPLMSGDSGKYSVYDSDGKQLDHIEAPKVVADFIFALLEAGGGKLEIIDYKPLPKEGEKIKSGGAGGGGDVRFIKFYLKHTDEYERVRYREVQIFVPDPATGRTGTDELNRKVEDQKRYGVARLFETKGTRSFMEAMRPASIYDYSNPNLRRIFKGRAA